MRKLLPIISAVALALVIVPACLYVAGTIEKPGMQTFMMTGTILWFITAPIWIGRSKS